MTHLAPTVQQRSPAHYDLFISYSRRDKDFVQRLHQVLITDQQAVWVDWEDILPVADWRQEIYRGIEAADIYICHESPFH